MIRNIIFLLVFYFGLIFLLILFIPSLILPQHIVTMGGRFLGYWTGFCLKYIMGTKIEIKGIENISINQKYFVASSHQSIFETFFLHTIFDKPVGHSSLFSFNTLVECFSPFINRVTILLSTFNNTEAHLLW